LVNQKNFATADRNSLAPWRNGPWVTPFDYWRRGATFMSSAFIFISNRSRVIGTKHDLDG